jgi:hypothetical protein
MFDEFDGERSGKQIAPSSFFDASPLKEGFDVM